MRIYLAGEKGKKQIIKALYLTDDESIFGRELWSTREGHSIYWGGGIKA